MSERGADPLVDVEGGSEWRDHARTVVEKFGMGVSRPGFVPGIGVREEELGAAGVVGVEVSAGGADAEEVGCAAVGATDHALGTRRSAIRSTRPRSPYRR